MRPQHLLDALVATAVLVPCTTSQILREYPSRHFDVPLGNLPQAADLNRDGAVDLISKAGGLRIHENLGQFRFAEVGTRSIPAVPDTQVATVDLDGDGTLDLVVASEVLSEPTPVRAYVRVGGLYREESWRLPSGLFHTRLLLAGDVDGDRDQDLLLVAVLNQTMRVLRNDGTGQFRLDAFALGNTDARVGVATDLNADNAVDVVLATWGGLQVALNNGQGRFAATVLPGTTQGSGVAAADFDNDGDVDLAATFWQGLVPLQMFANAGNGTFAPANNRLPTPREIAAYGVAVLDADRDGDADLAVATGNFNSELLLNSAGTFVRPAAPRLPLVPMATHLLAADVNGDGNVDLLASLPYSVEIWKNTAGAFSAIDAAVVPAEATVFADLNGDGDPDAIGVTAHTDAVGIRHHLFTARNDGSGRSTIDQVLPLAAGPSVILGGDIDGDRDNDVVTLLGSGTAAPTWQPYFNRGGSLAAGPPFALPPSGHDLGSLVDLDADGDADVLRQDGSALESTPAGFVPRAFARVPMVVGMPAAADIDGDWLPEVLLLDGTTLHVFGNRGAFAVVNLPGIVVNPPSRLASRLVAARGPDGAVRVLAAAGGPTNVQLTLHTFDGSVFQRTAFAQLPSTQDVFDIRAADIIGDRHDEFLVTLVGGGWTSTVVVDLGLADVTSQTFASPVPFVSALVDLDQDGDVDAVTAGRVWRGGQAHAHAPFAATLGSEFRVEFTGASVSLALLGASTVKIGTPLGFLRVDPTQAVTLPVSAYSQAIQLSVPNVPALRGLGLACQGFIPGFRPSLGLTNLERRVVR